MTRYDESRFAIAPSADGALWRWHAVDLKVFGPRLDAARGEDRGQPEVYSVCGQRCHYVAQRLGPFTYGSRWLRSRRCERCGWVVAFIRGSVEQEIAHYLPDVAHRDVVIAAGADPELLRRIFVAILADAPPGRDGEPGHRSDLLAHAARHRPVVVVCEQCGENRSAAAVHGDDIAACPDAVVMCSACTFTAGTWAGKWAGKATGECVVAAPCSVLTALACHYGLVVSASAAKGRAGHAEAGIA